MRKTRNICEPLLELTHSICLAPRFAQNAASVFLDVSLGSLRDLHMSVLSELLFSSDYTAEFSTNTHVGKVKTLAILHGLRREFAESQQLWERYVSIRDNKALGELRSYKHPHFYRDKLVRSPRHGNNMGRGGGGEVSERSEREP